MKFEKLSNTRDLGGMITMDHNRIKSGKLVRSGHLHAASEADKRILAETIDQIVDFRTKQEKEEKPDPVIEGVAYCHLPIFESLAAGVSRDQRSDEEAFALVAKDPGRAKQYMTDTYLGFVTSEYSISQYRRFLDILLKDHEKAVLWHCTAGKDRAGFATIIVLELLGVDRQTILGDYLKTNDHLKDEVSVLLTMLEARMGGLNDQKNAALNYLFGAHEEYVNALYQSIDTRFGSFSGFAKTALAVSPSEIETLRSLYLEH